MGLVTLYTDTLNGDDCEIARVKELLLDPLAAGVLSNIHPARTQSACQCLALSRAIKKKLPLAVMRACAENFLAPLIKCDCVKNIIGEYVCEFKVSTASRSMLRHVTTKLEGIHGRWDVVCGELWRVNALGMTSDGCSYLFDRGPTPAEVRGFKKTSHEIMKTHRGVILDLLRIISHAPARGV